MADSGDRDRLDGYIELWWGAVGDFCSLLDELVADLPAQAWRTPTDLDGWDVQAVVSHVAHLEQVLATGVEEEAGPDGVGDGAHLRGPMNHYCEIGVLSRREHAPSDLVAEIRAATTQRHDALLADPPTDASATPPVVFGGMPWTWEVLLRNRPLDLWVHEQDVRHALGRPGNTDSPAAVHSVRSLLSGQGFVLAKRLGAAPGTSVRWEVVGHAPRAFVVGEDGRGRALEADSAEAAAPTLTLTCDRETFAQLASGRRSPGDGQQELTIEITGDTDLAARYLADMGTTP